MKINTPRTRLPLLKLKVKAAKYAGFCLSSSYPIIDSVKREEKHV
jgi:hypothetical protein